MLEGKAADVQHAGAKRPTFRSLAQACSQPGMQPRCRGNNRLGRQAVSSDGGCAS
jgi:hypothetical protein